MTNIEKDGEEWELEEPKPPNFLTRSYSDCCQDPHQEDKVVHHHRHSTKAKAKFRSLDNRLGYKEMGYPLFIIKK